MTTVSGSFTANGVSALLETTKADTDVDFSIEAPFFGRVQLERSNIGGGAWSVVVGPWRNWSLSADISGRVKSERPASFRMRLLDVPASMVTNGAFAADTNWTKGAGWTIATGTAVATGGIDTAISQVLPDTLVPGASYVVTFTTTRSAGSVAVSLGGGTAGDSHSTSDTFADTVVAGSSDNTIAFTGTGFSGTVDNVSVTPLVAYSLSDTDAIVREERDGDGNIMVTYRQSGADFAQTPKANGVALVAGGNAVTVGSYTVVADDDTAGTVDIDTGLDAIVWAQATILRAGVNVTADAVLTWADGTLTVADGALTYDLTADDVIYYIVSEGA